MTTMFQTLFTTTVVLGDRIQGRVRSLRSDERGASAVEYALLVGAIAVAVIAGVLVLGPRLTSILSGIIPTRPPVTPPSRLRG